MTINADFDVRQTVLTIGPFGPLEIDQLRSSISRDAKKFEELKEEGEGLTEELDEKLEEVKEEVSTEVDEVEKDIDDLLKDLDNDELKL